MKLKRYLFETLMTALSAFVAGVVVTYLYALAVHGEGVINWETSVTVAIILGLVLPTTRTLASSSGGT